MKPFDLAQAAGKGISVLPDLTTVTPHVGDVLTVQSFTGGNAFLTYAPPGGIGAAYLPLSGGTLTGPLILAADPVAPLGAATRQYVDNVVSTETGAFLPLTGGTLTGPLNGTTLAMAGNSTIGGGTGIGTIALNPLAQVTPFSGLSQFQCSYFPSASGGTFSQVTTNGRFGTGIFGAPNAFVWGLLSTLNFSGTGGVGQHVAMYGQGIRTNAIAQPTTTVAITLGAPSGTISVTDITKFVYDNQPIQINGNPYYQVSHTGTTGAGTITLDRQVSVADGTAGNTVTGQNNPAVWAGTFESIDATNQPSSKTNAQLSVEFDLKANGADDGGTLRDGAPSGIRQILSLVGVKQNAAGADCEISNAIGLYTDGHTTFKKFIHFGGPWNQAALDLRHGTQLAGANTLWMASGQTIAFDANAVSQLWGDGTSLNASSPLIAQNSVTATGGAQWGTSNFGLALNVRTAGRNPAIGLADSAGSNYFALVNGSGTFQVAAAPAPGDTTTPPTTLLALNRATGVLTLKADPVGNLDAATKQYVDSHTGAGTYLPLAGGALTGGISFGSQLAASITDLTRHIALFGTNFGFSVTSGRLNYNVPAGSAHTLVIGGTDTLIVAAGTTTINQGNLVIAGSVTTNAGAQWTSSNFGLAANVKAFGRNPAIGLADSTSANYFALINNAGNLQIASAPAPGDTTTAPTTLVSVNRSTGVVTLHADPVANLDAATKQYVDTKAGTYLPLTGGTLIGPLSGTTLAMSGAVTAGLNINKIALVPANSGGTPQIQAGGLDANCNLSISASGTGSLIIVPPLLLQSVSGPSIRSGTGAATGTQPSGSLWIRTDGSAGARIYVSQGDGTWTPIASV